MLKDWAMSTGIMVTYLFSVECRSSVSLSIYKDLRYWAKMCLGVHTFNYISFFDSVVEKFSLITYSVYMYILLIDTASS